MSTRVNTPKRFDGTRSDVFLPVGVSRCYPQSVELTKELLVVGVRPDTTDGTRTSGYKKSIPGSSRDVSRS